MNKLLNHFKLGPGLLVLLLSSLTLYFSSTHKSHQQTASLIKIFRPLINFPDLVMDSIESLTEVDDSELDAKVNLIQSYSPPLILIYFYLNAFSDFNSFAFTKVPFLYFLFDIPPPVL